ncbi:MAG: hypothetical protein J5990_10955, partial [Bacteroidales bacterium]|nr:hypothetical protein [Bacteroidales bacterium]
DEKQIEDFVAHAKEETGFTDFYFISREGNYRTVSDETGYLDLKNELPELILHGKDMVVNSVVPGKPQIIGQAECLQTSLPSVRLSRK